MLRAVPACGGFDVWMASGPARQDVILSAGMAASRTLCPVCPVSSLAPCSFQSAYRAGPPQRGFPSGLTCRSGFP
ncbi:hypothetical protein DESPIG_00313 [Desulfovibrio piger ATCC 29098]|uniref:Uncharacterized protein n=1 Tax=Desulfovibrio piger ATCC 29098 TaxID=411464 RepID=B6WQI9_9BACT|nr:hypothetical protein DESPIG_00313 [Desulfovibrio piger ATCC 29098]